jgi:hypothetical protein
MQTANDIHDERKRRFFVFCAAIMMVAFIMISVVDIMEKDTREFVVDMIVMAILTGGLIAMRFTRMDMALYRVTHFLICLNYFYTVSIGAGEETVLFWAFFMPPLFFFFFGKREGTGWALFFLIGVGLPMTMPSLVGGHVYDRITLSRFFMTFPIVTIICFGLESSRHIFGKLLDEKNALLSLEKERLEQALKEIKTLSGMIPICANCKKVRNDEGFWEQVETYVRKRSTVEFSHGICPECAKKLYPGYAPKH